MNYLFTYAYEGKRFENVVHGQGSVVMTVNTDKITPELIKDANEWAKNDLELKGIKVKNVVPMGWFKFDIEESEDEDKAK